MCQNTKIVTLRVVIESNKSPISLSPWVKYQHEPIINIRVLNETLQLNVGNPTLTCCKHHHVHFDVQALERLDSQDRTDVVWAGDMNWSESDGQPPFPAGWCESSFVFCHVC